MGLFVELVDDSLSGDKNKIREISVELDNKIYPIYAIGIEDLIVDRLNVCVHWKSESDCELVKILIEGFKKEIDVSYLIRKAKENLIEDKLNEILEGLEIEDKL